MKAIANNQKKNKLIYKSNLFNITVFLLLYNIIQISERDKTYRQKTTKKVNTYNQCLSLGISGSLSPIPCKPGTFCFNHRT
jgi:hypothetical protein